MGRRRQALRENLGRNGQGVIKEFRNGDDVLRSSLWGGERARTVVLVHGIGMGQQYFGLLREELLTSFNVLAVDLPGFGDSPEPAQALTMSQLASLLAQCLREQYQGPFVVVGHSMGTQIVTELAVAHPELVSHLVLIAPTVNERERTMWQQCLRMLQDLWGESAWVMLVGLMMYAKAGPRWFLKNFRAMLGHRIEATAPKITVPTLVIRGSEDRVCPRGWVEFVAGLIPGAVMLEAEGRGHEAMMTAAEPVSGMIGEFVRG
ncbi:alpha/beta fold hydrolase [Psychromicrobium xiongbiense]|uniref:alpha/beta fold hydrolase n=1 Tax=Psychromicrobium xiongbiense TaxID=3051184 RepID=UPI00255503B8|nr:alpha/beta hydrolase [Psychromicrobium sp. YIM S02556]